MALKKMFPFSHNFLGEYKINGFLSRSVFTFFKFFWTVLMFLSVNGILIGNSMVYIKLNGVKLSHYSAYLFFNVNLFVWGEYNIFFNSY